jgi:hypothetical protein
MDRHVRWFKREIAVGVAQRLAVETFVAGAILVAVLLLAGTEPLGAIVGAFVAMPIFALLRVGLACFSNPLTSAYLMRWPHPSGQVLPTGQTNVGSKTDTALKGFQFTARGAFNEWGGAVTNVYTRDSNQIIVTTGDDDDLVVLTALDDERLVISSKQLIPPHERLVMNRRHDGDVRAILASHIELVKDLTVNGGCTVTQVGIDQVMELLAIEWDAWDQIGPLIGPFVSVGQRRQPTLLQVQVSANEILERTGASAPRITAQRASAPALAPVAAAALPTAPAPAAAEVVARAPHHPPVEIISATIDGEAA